MNIVKRLRLLLLAALAAGLTACGSSDPDVQTNGIHDDTLKQEAIDRIAGEGIKQLKDDMRFDSVQKGKVYFDKHATFTVTRGGCSVSVLRTVDGNIGVLVPYTKDSGLLMTDLDDEKGDGKRDLWNAVLIKSAADLETHKDLKDREEFKNCKTMSSTTASQPASTQPTN